MSAASTIAAPAATAPRVAIDPTTPGAKTELGIEPLVCMRGAVKKGFSVIKAVIGRYKGRKSDAVK